MMPTIMAAEINIGEGKPLVCYSTSHLKSTRAAKSRRVRLVQVKYLDDVATAYAYFTAFAFRAL